MRSPSSKAPIERSFSTSDVEIDDPLTTTVSGELRKTIHKTSPRSTPVMPVMIPLTARPLPRAWPALIAGREGLELALQAKVDVDPTAQAASFSPHDPRRSSRIQPTGPLVGIGRSLMPQSMVTPR